MSILSCRTVGRIPALAALFALATSPAFGAFRPDVAALDNVPRHILPPVAVARALEAAPRKDRPLQFAVAVPTSLSAADGLWEPAGAGDLAWRVRVHSAGARSLSFHFSSLQLPEGSALWIYAPDGSLVHGPYTGRDAPDGRLWTPVVPFDEAVVEIRAPAAKAGRVRFGIGHVYHGFRDFDATGETAKSGACNIDVACPLGAKWSDEVRSVARIQVNGTGGSFLCSGQLVNNARQDLTPYFLTADHCGIEDPDGGPADGVVLYFNYRSSQCNGTPNGDLSQTMTGSTFVADDVQSDFTLIRLNQAPPDVYDVYYAGWNVRGNSATCGVSIHHPNGDEKAISLFSEPAAPARVTIAAGRTIETWRVTWAKGTTEQGSSGGGLWNETRELIGVLSGGSASCGNRSAPDYFGRLDVAWTANPSADGQLKAHLDPENTGVTSIPGRDPERAPVPIGTTPEVNCGRGSDDIPGGSGGAAGLPALMLLLAAALLRRRIAA